MTLVKNINSKRSAARPDPEPTEPSNPSDPPHPDEPAEPQPRVPGGDPTEPDPTSITDAAPPSRLQ